jgi:hypothetical protein
MSKVFVPTDIERSFDSENSEIVEFVGFETNKDQPHGILREDELTQKSIVANNYSWENGVLYISNDKDEWQVSVRQHTSCAVDEVRSFLKNTTYSSGEILPLLRLVFQ